MDEPDEVDYGDSDSDFADLEVDDEGDGLPEPETTTSQPAEVEPPLVGSDREEGEATPRASPIVATTAASSELEDGEFVMDSEPMQLGEVESAHEAASKRQPDSDNSSSEEEGERRRRQQRRELGLEVGLERRSSRGSHQDEAQDTHRRSRARERDRREQGRNRALPRLQDVGHQQELNQGFRHGFPGMQPLSRTGSFPPPGHRINSEQDRRHPHPHGIVPGLPVRAPYGPPLEIRAASNLLVQSLRAPGQGISEVQIVYQLSAARQQHLHLAPPVLPHPPPVRQPLLPENLHGPPFLNRPPFDFRPPLGEPLLRPGVPRPHLNLGGGAGMNLHRSPLDDFGPYRQGSRPFDALLDRNLPPPPARGDHLHQGHPDSLGANFSRGSRPPLDLPRGGSGRMESLRVQLEVQGSAGGHSSVHRSDGQRRSDPPPPPPPPPARRQEAQNTPSRSPPGRVEPGGKEEQKQRLSFPPEQTQGDEEGRAGNSEKRDAQRSEGRSPRENGGSFAANAKRDGEVRGSPEKPEANAGSVRKMQQSPGVDEGSVQEKQPSPSVGDEKVAKAKEGCSKEDKNAEEEAKASSSRAEVVRVIDTSASGRGSSASHENASRGSQEVRKSEEFSRSAKRRREEDGGHAAEQEKDAREKEMRARALQILEAGRHKKRKERDEQRRDMSPGHEPGTSGRKLDRQGLYGSRRDGRDKRVHRNYRRRSGFDDVGERSRSRSDEGRDSPERPRRGSAGLPDERAPRGHLLQNGVFDGEQNGRSTKLAGSKGNGANAVPLGGVSRPNRGRSRGGGSGDEPALPAARRVVVGLETKERRPDLPRFSIRDRDRDSAPSEHAGRHSPGPPGFENRASGQRPRFGSEPDSRSRGALGEGDRRRQSGSPDGGAGLQSNGSGGFVSIGARQPSKTLAVNNLPENFKSDHILDIFNKYGPVQLVQQTGKSSVEVTFRREDEAKAARANIHRMIKLEGQEVLVEYKTSVPG